MHKAWKVVNVLKVTVVTNVNICIGLLNCLRERSHLKDK